MAAATCARRVSEGASCVLEKTVGGRTRSAGTEWRLHASCYSDLSWGHVLTGTGPVTAYGVEGLESRRRRNAIYDAARVFPPAPASLHRATGHCCGLANCWPQPDSGPGIDRVFREYFGAARHFCREPNISPTAATGKRDGVRSVCAPGIAVREAGGRVAAQTQPELHTGVSVLF